MNDCYVTVQSQYMTFCLPGRAVILQQDIDPNVKTAKFLEYKVPTYYWTTFPFLLLFK